MPCAVYEKSHHGRAFTSVKAGVCRVREGGDHGESLDGPFTHPYNSSGEPRFPSTGKRSSPSPLACDFCVLLLLLLLVVLCGVWGSCKTEAVIQSFYTFGLVL